MSSYIVEDKTIHRILAIFDREKDLAFARQLLRMNIRAVNARYSTSEPVVRKQHDAAIVKAFKLGAKPIGAPAFERPYNPNLSLGQAFMTLSCYLYQCTEGRVPKSKLYKQLREKQNVIANRLAHEMSEGCEWG